VTSENLRPASNFGLAAIDSQFSTRINEGQYLTLQRSSCPEFKSVNSATGRDFDVKAGKDGPIVNPMNIEIKDDNGLTISSQFQCGAVFSELSAKQYVAKMLLKNVNQKRVDGVLYLVDSRQLKNGLISENEDDILAEHRKLIRNTIEKLNGIIDKKDALVNWLEESNTNITYENLKALFEGEKKISEIKFLSCNFSAYSSVTTLKTSISSAEQLAGGPCEETKKNLQDLFDYLNINIYIFQLNDNILFKQRLKDLEKIIEDKKNYELTLAGYYSLATAMVINDLLNLIGGKASIGCKSNKDRGSNATIFSFITHAVFEHRKANISLVNFKLEDEEEKHIFLQIWWQNISYLPTLNNSGVAGNKSYRTWLEPLMKQAFGTEYEKARAFLEEFHSHSKKAEI
ncbi:MAG: hypothetical protein V4591_01250, partial [Bdellovibrionota bacterium]